LSSKSSGSFENGRHTRESDTKGDTEEIDFGHKEGDFLAFTIKLRRSDENRLATFFVGRMTGNKIVGTFVDAAGKTGEWPAVRLADSSNSR
jgi:hypothetical protein